MNNNNYGILDNPGAGDCFFYTIRDGFRSINVDASVKKIRDILANKADDTLYKNYKERYDMLNNEIVTLLRQIPNDKKRKKDITKKYNKMAKDSKKEKDVPTKKKIKDEAKKLLVKIKEFKKTIPQKEQELKSAEETGADTEKIQKKFELASKQIDKAKFNNRLELAGQTADALANLAGRESAAGKALAIVGATINTYQAAAAALAPPPIGAGPVFGPILAGTAIATGLANVRKIASVPSPKKAAKGGIFGGDYHSNGGTKGYFSDGTQIEVEKDELFMVLNRNSTDMINRMSSLNELGGGVAFGNESGSSFADGGIGVGSISSTIDAETASENQITAAIAAQPAPVVVVQDINEVQGETAQVADRAII